MLDSSNTTLRWSTLSYYGCVSSSSYYNRETGLRVWVCSWHSLKTLRSSAYCWLAVLSIFLRKLRIKRCLACDILGTTVFFRLRVDLLLSLIFFIAFKSIISNTIKKEGAQAFIVSVLLNQPYRVSTNVNLVAYPPSVAHPLSILRRVKVKVDGVQGEGSVLILL